MRTIRKSVFETNSSSTHSLTMWPVNDMEDYQKKAYFHGLHVSDGAIELPHDLDIEFGNMVTFVEKLKYIVAIMIKSNSFELGMDWDGAFDCRKANRLIQEKYPEFVKKVTEYVQNVTGKPCNRISFFTKNSKDYMRSVDLDHGVLEMSEDDNNFGLDMDPADIVIIDGIQICYEFA